MGRWSIFVLQGHLRQNRKGIEPRVTVVDHEYGLTLGSENPARFLDHAVRVGRVLEHTVRVNDVKGLVLER
jgi:hypothetical protein